MCLSYGVIGVPIYPFSLQTRVNAVVVSWKFVDVLEVMKTSTLLLFLMFSDCRAALLCVGSELHSSEVVLDVLIS